MLRSLLLVLAGSALVGWTPVGRGLLAPPMAQVRVTSSPNTPVWLIAPAAAELTVMGAPVTVHGDTIVARTPLRFTASLAAGELRIESVDPVALTADAEIADGPAARLAGGGQVLVFEAGGRGIHALR